MPKIFPNFQQDSLKIALVALAYFSVSWLTITRLELGTGGYPIWLPAGIAIAALLIWGERIWLGIALGDLLIAIFPDISFSLALGSATGSTLSALAGVKLLRRAKFSPLLETTNDVISLIVLAAIVSPAVNATVDLSWRYLTQTLIWQDFLRQWWVFWLGDSTGILLVTPLVLQLRWGWRQSFSRWQIIRLASLSGLLLAICWVLLTRQEQQFNFVLTNAYYLGYLPFPLIVWIALRFQLWGAILASLLFSLVGIIGILQQSGVFIQQSKNLTEAILHLQTYMGIASATALLLGASESQRQKTEQQLRLVIQRDRLSAEVASRIRQSLNLNEIFQTTVAEIRHLLGVDRVYIGYIDGKAKAVAESVVLGYPKLLGTTPDRQLFKELQTIFSEQKILVVDEIAKAALPESLQEFYRQYQVQSTLIVPLKSNEQYLGLLSVHQCSSIRHWQETEIRLLERLATQVSIAIEQARRTLQVQTLNDNLEIQVQERTQQLQEKIEQVQKLNMMKDVFLQAVVHDLRTSLMGLAMLLKNLPACDDDRNKSISISPAMLKRLIANSDRQLTLIDGLAEEQFNQPRSLELHSQPILLSESIAKLIPDWRSLCERNGVCLENLISQSLPAINGDFQQLKTVFDCLIDNAIKHNPPGIKLTLSTETLPAERQRQAQIRFTVADNGKGIGKQQCQQLFKLYLRSLHNPRLTGIGLGLYQCRQIIEAHGGKIGVDSLPDLGSQFWFVLPTANLV
jgi:signal transduction histidine kinase/integral membrane sensor domain MASE1